MPETESSFIVSEHGTGQRLDIFLADALVDVSRSRIQTLIRDGRVQHNDQVATKPRIPVLEGDRIEVTFPDTSVAPVPLPEDIPLNVLHEDAHILVLDKQPGIAVHPGPGNEHGTLVHALLHHCDTLSQIGAPERPGIVHRLDKDTSGCMVVAKSDAAHHELARQFSTRKTRKFYLAVVAGCPAENEGDIETPIGRHPINRKKMAVVPESRGKPAITKWKRLRQHNGATGMRCQILTGRTHQIRVHMHHIGHPILGDPIYDRKNNARYPDINRLMLHARSLAFVHPASEKPMEIKAPIPKAFNPWMPSRA